MLKTIVAIVLALSLSSSLSASANTDINSNVYFLPADSDVALADIISSIKNAKSNIKIAIYNFRYTKIAKSLAKASKNGVKINILLDKKALKDSKSKYYYLKKYPNITIHIAKSNQKMHAKYMIIDNKKVFFGSLNYTKHSFKKNYEVLYTSNDKQIVNKFIKSFNTIFTLK